MFRRSTTLPFVPSPPQHFVRSQHLHLVAILSTTTTTTTTTIITITITMPRRRRNDSDSDEGEDAPTKAELSALETSAAKLVGRQMESARDYFKAHKAPDPASADDLCEVVGVATVDYDELWSQTDEHRLLQEYRASDTDRAVQSISTSHTRLLKLWKTTCWEMRCSPLAIVGPRYGMVFQSSGRNPAVQSQASDVLWSKGFLDRLDSLVSHPVWEGNPARLATAIQAAVIFRTDNRRPWLIRCKSICEAMALFVKGAAEGFDAAVTDVMRAAALECTRQGQEVSPFFLLLRHLGECVGRPVPESSTDDEPRIKYKVRSCDLDAVIEAVNTLRRKSSLPMYPDVEVTAAMSHAARGKRSLPYGYTELRQLYERAWFHEMREAMREERRAAAHDSPARTTVGRRDVPTTRGRAPSEDSNLLRPTPDLEIGVPGRLKRRREPSLETD